jgi:hypothetical protein
MTVKASSPLEPIVVRADKLKYNSSVNFDSLAITVSEPGETKIELGESKYIE